MTSPVERDPHARRLAWARAEAHGARASRPAVFSPTLMRRREEAHRRATDPTTILDGDQEAFGPGQADLPLTAEERASVAALVGRIDNALAVVAAFRLSELAQQLRQLRIEAAEDQAACRRLKCPHRLGSGVCAKCLGL